MRGAANSLKQNSKKSDIDEPVWVRRVLGRSIGEIIEDAGQREEVVQLLSRCATMR
jgi:hypothetical protein